MDESNQDRQWYLINGQAYVPLSDEEVLLAQHFGYQVESKDPPWEGDEQ